MNHYEQNRLAETKLQSVIPTNLDGMLLHEAYLVIYEYIVKLKSELAAATSKDPNAL